MLELRPINRSNSPELLELFRACRNYFLMAENKLPDEQTMEEFFEDFPTSHSPKDKLAFGIYQGNSFLGVLDLLKNYAVPGEWMIGLLLLHPDLRNTGAGSLIHRQIVQMATAEGAHSLRIGVVTQNELGFKFWQKMGYLEIKRTAPIRFGNKENSIIIMQKLLK